MDIMKEINERNSEKTNSLDYIFASDLPDEFNPPDEILQDVLTAGDGSVLYGDSNSGKTFTAIDMAASISQGSLWFNKRTESGLVIYLAAESPASIRRRLQAYQKYHEVKLTNFIVVQNPIDLFSNDGDTRRIIDLIKSLEDTTKIRAKMIVGDTLARLSAGANENAGQDMGRVIQHFDLIRTETEAHFMLIHHSGKNAAAGARGWSGVRAAVDTEIEVTDSPDGRCIEITKQRDLDSKGMRIGFRLEPVMLGNSKFGAQTGSCVVLSNDAPMKKVKERRSEICGAILQILRRNRSDRLSPIDRKSLVSMLDKDKNGDYTRNAIYKEIKKLIESKEVIDFNGNIILP